MIKKITVISFILLHTVKADDLQRSLMRLDKQLKELHEYLNKAKPETSQSISVIDMRMMKSYLEDGTFPKKRFVFPKSFAADIEKVSKLSFDESAIQVPANPAVLTDKLLIIIFGEDNLIGLPSLKSDLQSIINNKEKIVTKFKVTQTLLFVYRIGKSALQKQANLENPGGPEQSFDDITSYISWMFFSTQQKFLGTASLEFVYFIVDDTGSVIYDPTKFETETEKWPVSFYEGSSMLNKGQANLLERALNKYLKLTGQLA